MSVVRFRLLLLAVFSLVFVDRAPSSVVDVPSRAPPPTSLATVKVPIRFEANAGQLDERVRFVARRNGGALFLGNEGATLAIQISPHQRHTAQPTEPSVTEQTVLRFKVAGAHAVDPQPSERLETKTHYMIGNDPAKWHTNVPTFAKVTYPAVLDGVDLVYHGENGALEYDFIVAPGTDVGTVAMNVEGADRVSLTPKGDLAIHTATGDLVQPRPLVYQRDANGTKTTIASSYVLIDKNKVGFEVASYDQTKPLVIDPILAFSTYLGGGADEAGNAVTADLNGNTYVTGSTFSSDFPTTVGDAFHVGGCKGGCRDVFVAKLNPVGQVVYATYLGGTQDDIGYGVAVNLSGEAFVAGWTDSPDFPVSGNPQVPDFGSVKGVGRDSFVTRLAADGASRIYSDIIPFANVGNDSAWAIAVDGAGRAYITGVTEPDFRNEGASPDGIVGFGQSSAYVARIDATGLSFDGVPRFLDGSQQEVGYGIAIDGSGNALITGTTSSSNFPANTPCLATGETSDAWVAKLNQDWVLPFAYVKCLGGDGSDTGNAIAADTVGNAYVVGTTSQYSNTQFPTLNPAQSASNGGDDAFVTKLGPTGTLIYSTFLGGEGDDQGNGVGIDSSGAAWVTGRAGVSDLFPVVPSPQPPIANGGSEIFVTRVSAAGNVFSFSVLFGGSVADVGRGLAVRGNSVHVTGTTSPASGTGDFPVLNPSQAQPGGGTVADDAFVAKISVPTLIISPPSVVVTLGGGQTFVAAGGAGYGYQFSITTNNSGGVINPNTGAYVTGPTGGVTDIIQVKDAFDLTATAAVQVGTPTTALTISPNNVTIPPKGIQNFTASGGTPPYQFLFASNASGASITPSGGYTAGAQGNVVDIVRVKDAANNFANATITVGPGITISPAQPAAPPSGSLAFTASGGSGLGYTWTISKNLSGGTINSGNGQYTAGASSSSVDTVKVTDSLGNTATVNVSVGGGLAITPSEPVTTTRGAIGFTAVGGTGAYTWSLTAAPSGGTIDPATGAYVAGMTGNVQDVVKCTDSIGNNASVNVIVGPPLTLAPSVATVAATGKVSFTAAGGSGIGYAFTISSNASGASIAPDGVYTAGNAGGVDTVRLTDSLGSTATATVTVIAPPPANPPPGSNPPPGFDGGTIPGINLGGGGNDDCSCRAVGSTSNSGSTRAIAALALVLGLVWRRRQRR